ncbi:phage gp6-like head-tail connector protein, partial [Salmonella enterica subsp. enterica]|nr:phage gp6-like head-tail connector protein [Salmonella enterica subsp. enterica]EEI3485905.1 phage gp6-like head-tail connector protein [Salmonella enterica subsp. enterica]
MIELVTLEEIKDHLHIDHDADDGPLKEKIQEASSVLLAFIQGSRDKVVDETGKLIEGEALSRMKGSTMRLVGMLYRNPDGAEKEDLLHGELPFSVTC